MKSITGVMIYISRSYMKWKCIIGKKGHFDYIIIINHYANVLCQKQVNQRDIIFYQETGNFKN